MFTGRPMEDTKRLVTIDDGILMGQSILTNTMFALAAMSTVLTLIFSATLFMEWLPNRAIRELFKFIQFLWMSISFIVLIPLTTRREVWASDVEVKVAIFSIVLSLTYSAVYVIMMRAKHKQ